MVFDPKRARKASCRVWLALAALGTVLGVHKGVSVHLSSQFGHLLASAVTSRRSHVTAGSVAPGEDDPHVGSSFTESSPLEDTPASSERTHPRLLFERTRRQLDLGTGNARDTHVAVDAPPRALASYGHSLLQHSRGAARTVGRHVSGASGRLAHFRGSRLEEPGSSSDASFADLGQPEGADLALVHGIEPGDSIVKHLLTLVSKQIHPVDRQAGAFRTLDKGLSATFWPQDVTVEVVSVRTGAPRRLRRGPVFGRGDFGMVFTASDVDTGAEFAAKVPIALREPFKMSQEDVMAEGRLTDAFATVKDPREAQAVLRFLVPTDMVQFPNKETFAVAIPGSRTLIGNVFFLMPKAYTDLQDVINAMCDPAVRDSDIVYHARLQLSYDLIRLVANLQRQGVVHGDFREANLLVMKDGRLFLADFGSMRKEGQKTHRGDSLTAHIKDEVMELGSVLTNLWGIELGYFLALEHSPNKPMETCGPPPPQYMVRLIKEFHSSWPAKPLLPVEALETPGAKQLVEEINSFLPLYKEETRT
ncbi:rhoptry protein ROP18 [Besnoitia besnoiti]|uniref:Rhoptry protein ROP18 n=2 Tax=Besnoitia besnoiti TaxID=94643 RepID=A0A2A9LWW3_BESBE|nr:rhoptry protein ROP18 [Besnoitia besnoiti]XP_029214988.1 rhoptry protein ROP18 [Besnoitia besnoiti]PFH30928.1 rhoptry protein ROP18 [Besnoitia besnoiti]PFH30978.1 rhoptry protein ROP18 [Besnoitia besnoiti]